MSNKYFAHNTAIVEEGAVIGESTKIWCFSHIMPTALVGAGCNIGQSVFVDNGAKVGNFCKLQNNVNVYHGVTLEDYVFCGPSMTFTNVKVPRCQFPRSEEAYEKTLVKQGASIGAQAVIVCGIEIGENALIGSGAVVTKNVPAHAVMVGNPARQIGWACACGEILGSDMICRSCGEKYVLQGNQIVEVVKK